MLSTVEICVKLQMTKTSEMCYNEEDTMWGLGVLPIGQNAAAMLFLNNRRNMDGKSR